MIVVILVSTHCCASLSCLWLFWIMHPIFLWLCTHSCCWFLLPWNAFVMFWANSWTLLMLFWQGTCLECSSSLSLPIAVVVLPVVKALVARWSTVMNCKHWSWLQTSWTLLVGWLNGALCWVVGLNMLTSASHAIKSQKRKLCSESWEFRPTCLWLQPKNDVSTEGLNWTPSPRGFGSRRKYEKFKCELSCWLLMFWKHLCKGSETLNRALKAFCLRAKGRKWVTTPQIGHKNRASSCGTHSSGCWKSRNIMEQVSVRVRPCVQRVSGPMQLVVLSEVKCFTAGDY